jgi:hypothetical protein
MVGERHEGRDDWGKKGELDVVELVLETNGWRYFGQCGSGS